MGRLRRTNRKSRIWRLYRIMVKGGIKIIKKEIISTIDILILSYKQEEIDFPFAPNQTLQAYWAGKRDALTELKNILED